MHLPPHQTEVVASLSPTPSPLQDRICACESRRQPSGAPGDPVAQDAMLIAEGNAQDLGVLCAADVLRALVT